MYIKTDSFSSSSETKKEWNYNSAPSSSLFQGMDKDKFGFYMYINASSFFLVLFLASQLAS